MSPAPLPQGPRIFRPSAINLARLAAILRRGDLVGVPSETVYGLAADALNPSACAKIFAAKGRPTTDPLIVHLASADDLGRVARSNPAALALAAAFWPGPLTLVLPKLAVVPDLVSAGLSTVAVRVPAHPVFRRLIRLSGCPLAAPSANPFGYISPTSAAHVRDGLTGTSLRAVLDGGECLVGVESTIVDLTNPSRPRLLRPGGLNAAAIERVLGQKLVRPRRKTISIGVAAPAPGMLSRHYSPRTPLILHKRLEVREAAALAPDEVCLLLRRPASAEFKRLSTVTLRRIRWLSERGELTEMAKNLFATLRILDGEGWRRIHAARVPSVDGLAPAINDRLERAAARG
jgi:L-threonylcarbamoyladenylate synthase